MTATAPASAPTAMPAPARRIQMIDWMRGLVMVLMTIDHANDKLDAGHLLTDGTMFWHPGRPLPAPEFFTRWLTHLCAPTFVLLAGASLALSTDKRREQPGQTAFLVKRGLLIAALDPLWMSLGFTGYHPAVFQVLWAIGMAMVCMAFLRKLSSPALLAVALAIAVGAELTSWWVPAQPVVRALWMFAFVGGHPFPRSIVAYPFVPWLAMMMGGFVLGRWLIAHRREPMASRAPLLAGLGAALLGVFAGVRGLDGYGNWGLHRESMSLIQWLHCSKYPPSIAYTALELGICGLMLALFSLVDDGRPRRLLAPLTLLGSTAFFYYLFHVHLLALAGIVLHVDKAHGGLWKTCLGALAVLLFLYPACRWYRGYKSAHPDGWTRYI